MERIVKNLFFVIILGNIFYGNGQNIDKKITTFGRNEIISYHVNEIADFKKNYSIDPGIVGFDTNQINLFFFSEVNDEFVFYVDNEFNQIKKVNTTQNGDGAGRIDVVEIAFPNGVTSATLKIESSKYGGIETIIRKEHPMVYLKNRDNKWYVNHTSVYQLPQWHFTRKTNKQ